MKPSIGRIVLVKTARAFNGETVHPAIINRVWSTNDPADARGSYACVNVTVFPDCDAPFTLGSVQLFETAEEAAAVDSTATCWWPPRA